MSVESLMVYGTHPKAAGRAAGWFQAGNLGGYGLGGGAGLWMAEHPSRAVDCRDGSAQSRGACCCVALLFVSSRRACFEQGSQRQALGAVLKDLWLVTRFAPGYLALLHLLRSDRLGRRSESVVRSRRRLGMRRPTPSRSSPVR
jgi:hypothetical protein